jgi:hypothetical protein
MGTKLSINEYHEMNNIFCGTQNKEISGSGKINIPWR